MKNVTIAFDVYGTLIDVSAVGAALRAHVGDRAAEFARTWRETQLNYSFRRALGRLYQPFDVCTRDALIATCTRFGVAMNDAERDGLLSLYTRLPAYADAAAALTQLGESGAKCFAFSNGKQQDVDALMRQASLDRLLRGSVCLESIQTYKPDPAAYAYFTRESAAIEAPWLVSGNPFDIIGARSVGWSAAWIRRDPTLAFDPWELQPTITCASLTEFPHALAQCRAQTNT